MVPRSLENRPVLPLSALAGVGGILGPRRDLGRYEANEAASRWAVTPGYNSLFDPPLPVPSGIPGFLRTTPFVSRAVVASRQDFGGQGLLGLATRGRGFSRDRPPHAF